MRSKLSHLSNGDHFCFLLRAFSVKPEHDSVIGDFELRDMKEYHRQYRHHHKDKLNESHQQYYTLNKDRIKESNNHYYLQNRVKLKESHLLYRRKNKNKLLDNLQQYYVKNKDRLNDSHQQYYMKNNDKVKDSHELYRLQTLDKRKESNRLYYLSNKDRLNESHQHYYHQNKDKILETHLHYYLQNKDKVQETHQQYSNQNKDRRKATTRRYQLKFKDKAKTSSRVYYLRNKIRVKVSHQEYYLKNRDKITESTRHYRTKNHQNLDSYLSRGFAFKSWKTPELVRKYFESIGRELFIANQRDWYRISRLQIRILGGISLYSKFENLGHALQFAYPDLPWDLIKFSLKGKKKSGQRWLRVMIEEVLPEIEIIEDFQHPELLWGHPIPDRHIELDLWLPSYRIGIEYHGEHHYFNLNNAFGPNGTASLYSERDAMKHSLCQIRGITLISIPYWWDGEKESVWATLYRERPDVFPVSMSSPIPREMPSNEIQEISARSLARNETFLAESSC